MLVRWMKYLLVVVQWMSNINLYKIDGRKKDSFLSNLNFKFDKENNDEAISKKTKLLYRLSVYIDGKDKKKKRSRLDMDFE